MIALSGEIDRDAQLDRFERFCVGVILLFVLACAFACVGCRTYYENAGMRVRAGSVTAPIEVSEPTSSTNIRLLFFLDGVDLYAAKGSSVEMRYYTANGGTWITGATTQAVEVVVTPCSTNVVDGSSK